MKILIFIIIIFFACSEQEKEQKSSFELSNIEKILISKEGDCKVYLILYKREGYVGKHSVYWSVCKNGYNSSISQ